MVGHGEKLIRLDLSNAATANDLAAMLKKEVEQSNRGEWIFGDGWNENNFPDRKIFHREELDQIAPDQPLYLTRVCRHAALVNRYALNLAGITKDTPDPAGGIIVRDANGVPTGYLLDTATELVKQVLPQVQSGYVERALQTAVDDLLRLGLVGGHTEDLHYYEGFKSTLSAFQKIIDGKKRKFRAHLLVHHEAVKEMEATELGFGEVSTFLELGAMKIFADGALGARTAWLTKPYTDDPTTMGVAVHSEDQLMTLVEKARSKGMPVAIHTIGDAALELALSALEAYPVRNGRDRLIHVQVIRPELIERIKKLNVILDLQPRFVAADFPWVRERLGLERMPYAFAWKTLLNHDLRCAGGSDAPIEPADPLLGIHAAVTRQKPEGDGEVFGAEQRLTVHEAVQLFTTGSAFAIGKEHTRGKIAVGYVADFTVLDQNLFHIPPERILSTNVLMTVVDNTIMYDAIKG